MIRDITRTLAAGFPAWPGDPAFDLSAAASLSRGDPCEVTRLTMSAHTGTHLDAPSHVLPGGAGLESIPLDLLVGPALVVLAPAPASLDASDLRESIRRAGAPPDPGRADLRILIRTESAETLPSMPGAFAHLAPSGARFLVELGIRLVGIDTPSVDGIEAADLPSHRILAASGAVILEWLDLRGVPPGRYQLAALPLRLIGAEASPVRAVLLDPPAAS